MKTDKNVIHYSGASWPAATGPVGLSVFVLIGDEENLRKTSEVLSYDESTGIFETNNTVYVPAGPEA